jgi:hypothetical protein
LVPVAAVVVAAMDDKGSIQWQQWWGHLMAAEAYNGV